LILGLDQLVGDLVQEMLANIRDTVVVPREPGSRDAVVV
jgi:hypothetical protein